MSQGDVSLMMRRIKLIVEYDGTDFYGFQRQPGLRTVDQVLEKAIARVTGEEVRVLAAGRTDAGVHALGQVVVFDTGTAIPARRFAPAINSWLPEDVQVISSEECSPDFNPRHAARSKTYRYLIYRQRAGYTLWRRYAHFYDRPLNIEAMQEAARLVVGRHDFAAFMASGSSIKDTVREVYVFRVHEELPWLTMEINGNGFLYHMVRNLAGSLLEVGRGAMTVKEFADVLNAGDRSRAGPTAPAKGLYLVEVRY